MGNKDTQVFNNKSHHPSCIDHSKFFNLANSILLFLLYELKVKLQLKQSLSRISYS